MNYLDKLKHLTQRLDTDRALQSGDWIEWQRADDLTQQIGEGDFIHVDDTGTRWAFGSVGESWEAVNMKFVTGSGHE